MAEIENTNETRIGLRADMTIDDEAVAIEGVIGQNFFLQLNKPASLGTPVSFAYWLQDTYKVKNLDVMLPYDEAAGGAKKFKEDYRKFKAATTDAAKEPLKKKIQANLKAKGIPEQLYNIMTTAFLAELTVTDLLIDYKAGDDAKKIPAKRKMMFGLSVGFPSALELLPNINVNKLSILIMNAPTDDFNFPKRVELPRSVPLPIEAEHATGSIEFSAIPAEGSTITLGKDEWKFVKAAAGEKEVAISDSLEGTLTSLAAKLDDASAGDTAKCKYVVGTDKKSLEITYKTVGVIGNEFMIAAEPNSKGAPSGPTLKGGQDEPKKTGDVESKKIGADGRITFSANPAVSSTITLNGVAWKFVKGSPGAGDPESQTSDDPKDLHKTIQSLADGLTGSSDPKIKKCEYTAGADSLLIIFKGSPGETFTLEASPKSNATLSSKTLTS
jgi:hypothetical protein